MHKTTGLFGALLSALFVMDAPLYASASMGAAHQPVLFEEGPSKLEVASRAFFKSPTVEALEAAMGAAGDLLGEMLEANKQALDAANPMLLSQWKDAFQVFYQAKHAALKAEMSDGNLYPDAFVERYQAGMGMGHALGVLAAIQRGEDVAAEARLASAQFFVLVAHLEKMGQTPFQFFFENTLESQMAPYFEGAARGLEQTQERSAWNMLTQFDTLEGVDAGLWCELKSLPMGLRSLFMACGQDKTHPEFNGRVKRLKNKNIARIVEGESYPEELECIAQGWRDTMAMDSETVEKSRAALSGLLKECVDGDTAATMAQLEACIAKYARDRKRASDVMDFFWRVEKHLFATLYHERFPRDGESLVPYAPLQEAWGKETAAPLLLEGYTKAMHQRSVLTIGEVRTLLGGNVLEDAQEEDA